MRRWQGQHFRQRVQSLREQLLATGLTRLPVCPRCQQEKYPHDFVETVDGQNICFDCHHGATDAPSLFDQGDAA